MIISVSGYAGTGKDTVGHLVKYLTSRAPIEKQTFEEYMSQPEWTRAHTNWEIRKWAGKLKLIASLLTGIKMEQFEDQEFKKTNLGAQWNRIEIAVDQMSEQEYVSESPMSVRDFLQRLGTDGLRNGLHTNVWVNALMSDYLTHDTSISVGAKTSRFIPASKWIITDTRFPNELAAVKDQDGITIRITRPGVTAINAHPSETALDDATFDHVIVNNGSMIHLEQAVLNILHQHKILW